MSLNRLTDKQTLIHPYNEIPFSLNSKKQTTDTRNIDDSQIHHSESRKPVSKGYIIYNSIYVTFWKGIVEEQKKINNCLKVGKR